MNQIKRSNKSHYHHPHPNHLHFDLLLISISFLTNICTKNTNNHENSRKSNSKRINYLMLINLQTACEWSWPLWTVYFSFCYLDRLSFLIDIFVIEFHVEYDPYDKLTNHSLWSIQLEGKNDFDDEVEVRGEFSFSKLFGMLGLMLPWALSWLFEETSAGFMVMDMKMKTGRNFFSSALEFFLFDDTK